MGGDRDCLGAGLLLLGAALVVCTRVALGACRRGVAALLLSALAVVPATGDAPACCPISKACCCSRSWPRSCGASGCVARAPAPRSGWSRPRLCSPRCWPRRWLGTTLVQLRVADRLALALPHRNFRLGAALRALRLAARRPHGHDRQSAPAEYWKAENLDVFNGLAGARGWGRLSANLLPRLARRVRSVDAEDHGDMQAMRTTNVIAAGTASRPSQIDAAVSPGESAGTWTAQQPLAPGSTYRVSTYSPRPSPAQLAAIPATAYPDDPLANYRVVGLPAIPAWPRRQSAGGVPAFPFLGPGAEPGGTLRDRRGEPRAAVSVRARLRARQRPWLRSPRPPTRS